MPASGLMKAVAINRSLLEVQGSLRLFGGLEALRQCLRRALGRTGHTGLDAVAPTPLAALWLARARDPEGVIELSALAGRLLLAIRCARGRHDALGQVLPGGGEGLLAALAPIHEKRDYYDNHPDLVEDIIEEGRAKAGKVARQTMAEVRNVIGM